MERANRCRRSEADFAQHCRGKESAHVIAEERLDTDSFASPLPLKNALKFTRSGHVKVTLRYLGRPSATTPHLLTPRPRVSSLDQGSYRGYVVFVVEDTGIGMSPEFLREGQIFTPFKQADSFSYVLSRSVTPSLDVIRLIIRGTARASGSACRSATRW